MISSLSAMGVSRGDVLGLVDRGSKAFSPPRRYALTHRSRVRFPYGHTCVASVIRMRPSATGRTQRNRSSLIVLAIWTAISRLYREPPYVCAHYRALLTNFINYVNMPSV